MWQFQGHSTVGSSTPHVISLSVSLSRFKSSISFFFFSVEYIRIKPDPPVKGESLTVDFKGYLYEEVTEGSTVDVKVKYGAIKLLQKQFDLCEEAKQVNRTCPIEKGDFHLIHTADIPKDIPPVSFEVHNG